MINSNVWATWAASSATASAGTAFTRFIPPYTAGANVKLHMVDGNQKRIDQRAITHITKLVYTDGGTNHAVTVLRPLNWTYITEAVTANDTTLVVANDPGLYATYYRYPLPGSATKPAAVADNAAASGDYVAFQLRDGTWHVSTLTGAISSLTLTIANATPNVTGGGCDANTILYFFGVASDSNPQTGAAHLNFASGAGSARLNLLHDVAIGSVPSLNPGDPMLIYSANATNAGTLNIAAGYYSDR